MRASETDRANEKERASERERKGRYVSLPRDRFTKHSTMGFRFLRCCQVVPSFNAIFVTFSFVMIVLSAKEKVFQVRQYLPDDLVLKDSLTSIEQTSEFHCLLPTH